MRAPLSWIRDFAPIPGTTAEIAERLDNLGLIVDGIDEPGREIGGVVVARVLAIRPHPNADKLILVDIDYGVGQTSVVCGASNFAVGDVVPYAGEGATLPGGMVMERRKIRGEISDGMLNSTRELGLGEDHSGIVILPVGSEPGTDVREVLGLDDVVFDLDVTPNRPDAMSIVGVARDLAAATRVPFTLPEPEVTERGAHVSELASLVVEAPERCPRYVARVGRARIGPSPDWLQRRLTLAGMRPISNVVDVTNYVLLELGHPLHVFDLAKLGGRGILVRMAAAGEAITTLDEIERTLTDDDLLICDATSVPQAVAGVMGGGDSEVSDATTEVLLEAAYFQPAGVLRTSKRLGLRTESSARFERGVDPNGVDRASRRAMALFAETAGGEAAPGALDAYPQPIAPARITVRTERVNAVLGTGLLAGEIVDYLAPIQLECAAANGNIEVTVPTFRPDIEREIDVIEEVARHHGYHRIERTVPRAPLTGKLAPHQRERRLVRATLSGFGLLEATTLSLLSPNDLRRAGLPTSGVELENPLRVEECMLRPALLPGLLRAVAYNADYGFPDVALFEIGHVFAPPAGGDVLPDERERVAAVLAGSVRRRPHERDRPVDSHDAVSLVEALAEAFALADWQLTAGEWPGLHPTRCAHIVVDGQVAGAVGEIAPAVTEAHGLAGPLAAFEVEMGALWKAARRPRRYQESSRFPASSIDLAFVVDETVAAGDVQETLRTAAGPLAEDVRVFDVFRSDALGPGKKSLAFALRFRAPDRTLTDDEVGAIRQRCIDAVAREHGATLRG